MGQGEEARRSNNSDNSYDYHLRAERDGSPTTTGSLPPPRGAADRERSRVRERGERGERGGGRVDPGPGVESKRGEGPDAPARTLNHKGRIVVNRSKPFERRARFPAKTGVQQVQISL